MTVKEQDDSHEVNHEKLSFENKKILNLNSFFMKNALKGLIVSLLLFVISIALLIYIIIGTNMDESVKISIISMISTFILTTSKSLIDRFIEITVYILRLLGEEQRGLNKKMGIDIKNVEFETLSESQERDK